MSGQKHNKLIIYQVFMRLAGNTNTHCIPYGSIRENGCGKFNDLSEIFLDQIRQLGATHIWLTGVLEHATCQDYSKFGIIPDNPLVVKGRAGSPYAIKDYYDVDPDLAEDVDQRMQEFQELVNRCHQQGLKPIIDFVPNHVARHYESDNKPPGIYDFGAHDDPTKAFSPANNFYYIPGKPLQLPREVTDLPYAREAGQRHFEEFPAKATGNDQFNEYLNFHDWYETIKLNYGVDYLNQGSRHFEPRPDTWNKMLDILLFWAEKNVSGFRCDMAEMVPVEFWEWVIPEVKKHYPELIFIAEIYNPAAYRDFIHRGKFDYLYDKMGLYDTLRAVIENTLPASSITGTWQQLEGIGQYMLRFMENHDEQRLASPHFAGTPLAGMPSMTVSATIHQGPLMIYFGQETGEPAQGEAGFSGDDGRTSIFDYFAVPTFQQWFNKGRCDEENLSSEQKQLRSFYSRLLNLCRHQVFTSGNFYDLMWANNHQQGFNQQHCYTYLRWDQQNTWLVLANFSKSQSFHTRVNIPEHFREISQREALEQGVAEVVFASHAEEKLRVQVEGQAIRINIEPYQAVILSLR